MSARLVLQIALVGLVGSILAVGSALGAEGLVVHEWGTFTALQDDSGSALGGINVDDEPLPDFVHDLNRLLISRPYSLYPVTGIFMKAVPQRHPNVTLRLETPVIYFHLPPGAAPVKLDVNVELRGGWLTQFYPNADVDAPGIKTGTFAFGRITPQTVGKLSWKGLTVGAHAAGPKTDQPVWTAPRNVQAADLTTAGQQPESEKYLFYRGVGNFAAPLEVATDSAADRIRIRGRFENVLAPSERLTVGPLWLVQIQSDGRLAYRTLPPLEVNGDPTAIVARAPRVVRRQRFFSWQSRPPARRIAASTLARGSLRRRSGGIAANLEPSVFSRSWLADVLPRSAALDRSLSTAGDFRAGGITPRHGWADRASEQAAAVQREEALRNDDLRPRLDAPDHRFEERGKLSRRP